MIENEKIVVKVVKGDYKGNVYITDMASLKALSFSSFHIRKVIKGEVGSHLKCTFRLARLEDKNKYPTEIPKGVIEELNNHFTPILVTVVEGDHKGYQFVLTSIKEMKQYFNKGNVYSALSGKLKTHRKCIFEYISTKEVNSYPKLTKEIMNDLENRFKPIKGMVVEGKHIGFQFVLTSSDVMKQYFDSSSVYAVLSGRLKTHRKCVFERIPLEEVGKYPKLI